MLVVGACSTFIVCRRSFCSCRLGSRWVFELSHLHCSALEQHPLPQQAVVDVPSSLSCNSTTVTAQDGTRPSGWYFKRKCCRIRILQVLEGSVLARVLLHTGKAARSSDKVPIENSCARLPRICDSPYWLDRGRFFTIHVHVIAPSADEFFRCCCLLSRSTACSLSMICISHTLMLRLSAYLFVSAQMGP